MNFSLFAALFITLITSFSAHAQCPDLSKNETAEDCPWAEVTRATAGLTDAKAIRAIIDQKIPGFLNELDTDAKVPGILNLWGLSRNIDASDATDPIVPKNLLQFFASILNVQYNADVTQGPAGLTHTYGYLFSTLSTPFGYKRARYVQGEIEAGFGFSAPYFNGMPVPSKGTLLQNFTAFLSPIAFRDSLEATEAMTALPDNVNYAPAFEVFNYPVENLAVQRLVEVVDNDQFYLELRTDIVPFTQPNPKGTDTALLIYSIDYHLAGDAPNPRLITAFPVQGSFAKGLFDPTQLGEQKQLQLKYNAALPVALTPPQLIGKRFIYTE
jgi:hypothetical protein